MLSTVFSWLTGGVLSAVLKTVDAKDANQKEIILAQLAAKTEQDKIRAAIAPQFKWLIYAITAPCILHFSLVMIDSSLPSSWGKMGIPKVPPPYDTYEAQIILSFFIVQPIGSAIKGVVSWLHK